MPDEVHNPQIRIDKIPAGGGIASLIVISVLLATMLVELPALRWPFVVGAAGGIVVAVVLMLWRRFHR